MELQSYTTQVQEQLVAAAGLGDERAQQTAAVLARAAEPAIRLALLAALTGVADEITAALLDVPGAPAVSVRLDGDTVRVDVRAAAPEVDEPARVDDADTSARISLRLSESLKADVDAAAARDGVSVNTWLVRAASSALAGRGPRGAGTRGRDTHRITGWING